MSWGFRPALPLMGVMSGGLCPPIVYVYVFKPELLVKFSSELDAALRYLLWHVSASCLHFVVLLYKNYLVASNYHTYCIFLSVLAQLIAWKDSSPKDLLCIELDTKLYSLSPTLYY